MFKGLRVPQENTFRKQLHAFRLVGAAACPEADQALISLFHSGRQLDDNHDTHKRPTATDRQAHAR
jgi:hypothetical protein